MQIFFKGVTNEIVLKKEDYLKMAYNIINYEKKGYKFSFKLKVTNKRSRTSRDLFSLFVKCDYSFEAKYLSASKAAIQPVPAAVIA